MIFGTPLPDMLMCSIAERSILWNLAVAKLVVAGFGDIKGHRSAPRQNPLALTMSATTPVVRLTTVEEHVSREYISVCRHARWSIAFLLVWSWLSKVSDSLLREVSHVVHRFNSSFTWVGRRITGSGSITSRSLATSSQPVGLFQNPSRRR